MFEGNSENFKIKFIKENVQDEVQYDELGRIIITDVSQIPEFKSEAQKVVFWNTHAMSEELLEETHIEEDDEDFDLLERLQKMAEIKNIPYQTLLKQFLVERVYEEEKRERVL